MFLIPYSKTFSPMALGQDRTVGRALSMERVEMVVKKNWPNGVYGTDVVAAHLGEPVTGLEYEVSDAWGPLLLGELWRSRLKLVKEKAAPRALELASRYLRMQIRSLPHVGFCPKAVNRLCEEMCSDGRIQSLLTVSIHMKRAVELSLPSRCRGKLQNDPKLVPKVAEKYSGYQVPGLPLEFKFTADVVLVRLRDTWYASSHDHLLCYTSKLDMLVSYAMMFPWAGKTYLSGIDVECLDSLIDHLQSFHAQTDQKFFKCAKLLDGLCQAVFLMTPAVDGSGNSLLLNQIKKECDQDPDLTRFYEETMTILRPMSAPALIEASSLGKCSGHPSVDVAAGLEQLKHRTCNDRPISIEWVTKSVNSLKEHYITEEILRERRWPPLLPGATKSILDLVANDAIPNGERAARLNIVLTEEDWKSIDFAPTRKMQQLTSIIPFIKDRTISLDRDDTLSTYPIDFVPVPEPDQDPLTPRETYKRTSLVLYMLLTRGLNEGFKEFLDVLIRSSPQDLSDLMAYLVIKVVPKEGELKTLARLFGEKTFNYRLHGVLQEMSAVGFMQDTFPRDQAMTCGELELKKRLHALTTLRKLSPDHEWINIDIDVKGWNGGFRHETVAPIGKVMDQIFGTSVYEKTMKLYEHTLVVNKGVNGLTGWQGQLGGIEGQNQDTWVIAYLSQLHAIFSSLAYKYYLMDMGDNLVVRLAVHKNELMAAGGPAQFAQKLAQKVGVSIKAYGHDMKPDESTGSHNAFIFCHQYSVRGVQIMSHFRKAGKMSGISDAFFPLPDNYIGCSMSTAHATVEQGYLAFGPYFIASTWSFMYLLSSQWPVIQKRHKNRYCDLQDEELLALMLTPNVLGGFPILYLETLFLRSEADHLPQAIRLQKSLMSSEPAVGRILDRVLRQPRDPEASLLTLLADPRSLALTRPMGPYGVVMKELEGRLSREAKNEELAALYEQYNDEAQEILVKALKHNKHWPARLLSAIYGSSGFSAREAVVACFKSSRTSIAFLLRTRPHRLSTPVLCRKALASEQQYNRWRVNLIFGSLGTPVPCLPSCFTGAANAIRRYHWKREVTTITTPPMGHLFKLVKDTTMPAGSTYISIRIGKPVERVGNVSDHHCSGEFEPFLGHTTSSATRNQMQLVRSKDQMVDGVLNLALASSWAQLVDDDGSLRKLIGYLVKAYTNLTVEELQLVSGERSHGTIEHHLRGRGFNPSIAPNSMTSLLSLATYDTRYAEAFQMGKKYTVNFLEEILFAIYMLLIHLQWSRRIETTEETWLLVLQPCECFQPIEVERITAKMVGGVSQLAGSILPPDARKAITEQLSDAVKVAGERGVVSMRDITSSESASSLLMMYWASLTNTLETLSKRENTDTEDWRHLAYIQGLHLPKEISLNIMRRIPPQRLVTILKTMNTASFHWEERRRNQLGPGKQSVHTPGATALMHICSSVTEGTLMSGLGPYLPNQQNSINAHNSPLYQMLWNQMVSEYEPQIPREILFPSDQDVHVLRRALQLACTPELSRPYKIIAANMAGLKLMYDRLSLEGEVSASSKEWMSYLGLELSVDGATVCIRRHHPTAMQDTARAGPVHYSHTQPHIPEGTPAMVAELNGFSHALVLYDSLRNMTEETGIIELPEPPRNCREVWHSTTRSPSRFISAACQIGLVFTNGMKVAVVGDGLGGISHLLAQMDRELTIFYSTLYAGPGAEQAPHSIRGPRAQVLMTYMQRNLRDVTNDAWGDIFIAEPDLVPDVLISDAELRDEEMHVMAATALGRYMLIKRKGLLLLRVRRASPAVLLDTAAELLRYCDQVAYAPTPSDGQDGYLVARYGREAIADRKMATYRTKEALVDGCGSLNPTYVLSSVAWCCSHGALSFPALTYTASMGITARHLTDTSAARDVVSTEVDRILGTMGATDLGGLSLAFPVLVALDEHNPTFHRVADVISTSYERLLLQGKDLRQTLMALCDHGLIRPDEDVAAADIGIEGHDI